MTRLRLPARVAAAFCWVGFTVAASAAQAAAPAVGPAVAPAAAPAAAPETGADRQLVFGSFRSADNARGWAGELGERFDRPFHV